MSAKTLLCAVAASAAVAVALAMPQVSRGYELPDAIQETLSGQIVQSFTCEGRDYGYYADVDNNCELFHICLPLEDEVGNILETAQWTFACGNGTMFDQQTLTCNYRQDSVPCEEAPSLYNTVEFGRIDDN